MNAVIVYGSRYGTAKRYSQELSGRMGIPAKSYDECGALEGFDTVVYIGALYAGGVLGLRKTFDKLPFNPDRKVIIATVGLADPEDQHNMSSIRESLEGQLSKDVFGRASIFHLRGGIDYSRLGLVHKTMMDLLYRKAKGLPADQQTADSVAMVETYGKVVSFMDFATLDPIIAACFSSESAAVQREAKGRW